MKPPLRIKSVSTKVSEEEFVDLESRARARKLTLSEWVRAELLEPKGGDGGARTEVLLGEVLALRTILMNLLFSISNGKAVTAEAMRELIEKADGDKERRAMERLLTIVEEEGAHSAAYALKLLRSENVLTIASTGKDPATARLLTHQHRRVREAAPTAVQT